MRNQMQSERPALPLRSLDPRLLHRNEDGEIHRHQWPSLPKLFAHEYYRLQDYYYYFNQWYDYQLFDGMLVMANRDELRCLPLRVKTKNNARKGRCSSPLSSLSSLHIVRHCLSIPSKEQEVGGERRETA
ncbi:hypothetical protein BHM03_00002210 [Ensete ventricosum]|nr:hypothetical protein BHM03_00002210 [Ensete ventricosum]